MKRKRKLISFSVKVGLHNEDFIHARRTLVIHYRLKGQKLRRGMFWHIPEYIEPSEIKSYAIGLYNMFKLNTNIKHT